jgi:dihydroorotate dehydrogenase electron transfer subunit
MLCEQLARSGHETRVFFGAASKQTALGCGLDDFRETGLPVVEATDDGSLGERGFITEPLDKYLRDGGGERAIIYSCGPWAMMKRVAELARKHGVRCLVSLEAPMGCGFGVCVGCVVAVNNVEGGYHSYKRVCVDGSILPADLVRWDVNAMSH